VKIFTILSKKESLVAVRQVILALLLPPTSLLIQA